MSDDATDLDLVEDKLKCGEKFSFGVGDFAANILQSAISFYFIYFLINVSGVTPYFASVINIAGRAWDAIASYAMGGISDRCNHSLGKRRVFIIFGALTFGASFVLLWITPGQEKSQGIKAVYYIFMYIIYDTCWAIVYTPYNTLSANMTKNYDERTSLNGWRITMANIGIIFGAALFALLADGTESLLYKPMKSVSKAYTIAGVLFAILSAICVLCSGLFVKERCDNTEQTNKSIFQTIKELFSIKEFRNCTLTYVSSMVGFDVIMMTFMFFVNDSLKFGGGIMAMVYVAIPLVCAILSAAFWVIISEKFSKAAVYSAAAVYMAVVLIFAIFIPEKTPWAIIVLTIFAGMGMSGIQILPNAALPDVVEIDEYRFGTRREGAYYGLILFLYKVCSGVFMSIVSAVLGAFGYKESTNGQSVEQPKKALMAVRVVIGTVPGIFFLLGIIPAIRGRISREEFAKIKQQLAEKHAEQNPLEKIESSSSSDLVNLADDKEPLNS
ncbi:Major Facilitator Superfamily protein [Trichomonas vaginalis G3]|uniref:Major Facilitator Superfamily protein n=1 Tax=Trichomonas vaginalis (strain ATCC PRA-98 / G3) TaxID=412133 RepID=A2DWP3_TRIV3|nr:major facilitator superfamily transporter [Trichomonas vaginalis G3]EAY15228.1 Major Facilitator Superfamily protein [Trichomonas vaginalis G3]KAI5550618.1 MFS/sugar transport protein family [Trichomonas vaginalis G3]|eukprot:XP_001327451.1 major facilitator superfamily transporter [Trichomonas vaginalis G3]